MDEKYVHVFDMGDNNGYYLSEPDTPLTFAIPLKLWDKYLAAMTVAEELSNEIKEYEG